MAGRNAHYWAGKEERAKLAKEHVDYMYNEYILQTRNSARETKVYDSRIDKFTRLSRPKNNFQTVVKDTTDGALFKLVQAEAGKVALLNFASYKNPGGGFLQGSSAQEESLCMVSNLYNIISGFGQYYEYNNHHLNKGLYTDRALYSPNVIFIDPSSGDIHKCDVITCAAPNKSLIRYGNFDETENAAALTERIRFLRDICITEKVNTVILGAWGCGVFMQNPGMVATLLFKKFDNTGVNCIYAIPDDKNYNTFLAVLNYLREKGEINS